jgi:hypothetical protein
VGVGRNWWHGASSLGGMEPAVSGGMKKVWIEILHVAQKRHDCMWRADLQRAHGRGCVRSLGLGMVCSRGLT